MAESRDRKAGDDRRRHEDVGPDMTPEDITGRANDEGDEEFEETEDLDEAEDLEESDR